MADETSAPAATMAAPNAPPAEGGRDSSTDAAPGGRSQTDRRYKWRAAGGSNRGKDKLNGKKRKHQGFGSARKNGVESWEQKRAAKRQKMIDGSKDGESLMKIPFTSEQIAAEERRPKRKVAVMIGYAGTGYSGLQMNHKEKTIESDIFAAFVAAGAIAKANADDPHKSSLMRCARTDKGVHAAGNVLSLKLIIEDADIVDRINEQLPPQIRVWGIQRTNNSFNCYQACDSRWYEYLMPSYALLPPMPTSFLGKKIVESAKEKGMLEEYTKRVEDVSGFWDNVEQNDIQPILYRLGPELRASVVEAMKDIQDQDLSSDEAPTLPRSDADPATRNTNVEEEPSKPTETAATSVDGAENGPSIAHPEPKSNPPDEPATTMEGVKDEVTDQTAPRILTPTELAIKDVKAAYIAAKRRYRVTPTRLEKFQAALDRYVGTNNFHNYTILKKASDPSAKRHIHSFTVNPEPIRIRDTEWLSMRVHGQSFMMHQIRKMVAMAVMVTRCGAPLDLIRETYGARRISIPKAPGLGLMLERPVFAEYNRRATGQLGREAIDFANYEERIREFKDREIYSRMFEVEEKENAFHTFFHQLDHFRTNYFLWVTAGGLQSAYERAERGTDKIPKALEAELGNEADGVEEVDS